MEDLTEGSVCESTSRNYYIKDEFLLYIIMVYEATRESSFSSVSLDVTLSISLASIVIIDASC